MISFLLTFYELCGFCVDSGPKSQAYLYGEATSLGSLIPMAEHFWSIHWYYLQDIISLPFMWASVSLPLELYLTFCILCVFLLVWPWERSFIIFPLTRKMASCLRSKHKMLHPWAAAWLLHHVLCTPSKHFSSKQHGVLSLNHNAHNVVWVTIVEGHKTN